ncbi:hypothetical protein KI614_09515 [Dechloromonas denitrificans]|uniref:hypothetical protein n=1 Tax=Dechloromonas denitrificans TaxID=281362 RepID=UPI001CF90179|nr:hypothetical protein [Dechloromonas denitrificans]UCV10443.1 hypothetical protein KI614_09515 [Dechloromonas denitrificans]
MTKISQAPFCATVRYLEKILADIGSSDRGMSGIVGNALAMIQNMNQHNISQVDLACLQELLKTIDQDCSGELNAYLSGAEPDCLICAALRECMVGSL